MVVIGSARQDENGKLVNGQAGDNNGKEVSTQDYYTHKYGWYVLRCKDITRAKRIATAMKMACNNDNIGYDQNNRLSLYNAAKKHSFDISKVNVKCETDCSALVRVCLAYANIEVPNFTTANEKQVLLDSGYFNVVTGGLQTGDILVTRTKGHTAIVVDDGTEGDLSYMNVLKVGSKGKQVKILQLLLSHFGYPCGNIDGDFGAKTKAAVIKYQAANNLVADGYVGTKTWKALLS